ncbi:MAG: glycosyltransferase [Bryobacterales bacterium]|nr:glycosyltransferase [Bryobacterales bacterium]
MRILLTANASYAPPKGGSTRANLVWLRQLASAGHQCVVVCPSLDGRHDRIEEDGIAYVRVHELARRTELLASEVNRFQPDWLLVSSEDVNQVLLGAANRLAPGRLIYLAHTPQFLPFGPESWSPNEAATEIIRQAAAVVVIGDHMASYVRRHAGCGAVVVRPNLYGLPPFPRFGRFGDGFALMINPCAVKGISIFVELAARFPHLQFAGLKGWGTTSADLALMAHYPNIRVLDTVAQIDEVFREASLLLMPSLWYEGFGLIAMEAMLRGLPVISSDSGGLTEAKQGTSFVIPVRAIESYEPVFDEARLPRPVLPPQDLNPWIDSLRALFTSRELYLQESERSREAGLRFMDSLSPGGLEPLLQSLKPSPAVAPRRALRILLAHNSLYYPAFGGGDKSNRMLMEALASRGHEVRVVARIETFGEQSHQQFLRELEKRQVTPGLIRQGVVHFRLNQVDVRTVTTNPQFRNYFAGEVREYDPDIIVTSTDDPAQLLFDVAVNAPRSRVVHLVRATIAVPFGPDSSAPSTARAEALRRADAIAGVSEYVARYVREYGRMDAVHVPISLMEPGDFPNLGGFENDFVTLVNPCAVKGIDIFLQLAARMPDVRFAAVPTWGTNAGDLERLRSLPNIEIIPPFDRVADLMRRTRVLLVPSLWAEARSRIVVEAMAFGLPVVASDIGGIPEAKLGVPYLLPVKPITRYRAAVDENMVPVAEVPEQNVEPWRVVLDELVSDPEHYARIAQQGRQAALQYIRNLSVEPFEQLLERVARTPKRSAPAVHTTASALTADKQRLLALRLKQRAGQTWFPGLLEAPAGKLRLFCFPHAGGGAAAIRGWRPALAAEAFTVPVMLPGRESRIQEAPVDDLHQLVELIGSAMESHLRQPYAFFGHSMGAAIAFELIRLFRAHHLPLPRALFVSAARAPQFRSGWTPPPEPGDEELIAQLRRLDGVPAEALNEPQALKLLLPPLRADTRLYRRYVYTPAEPLDLPVFAYGGRADPNVAPHHLEAWREQTRGRFYSRQFQGGHFYLRSAEREFLESLAHDLQLIGAKI